MRKTLTQALLAAFCAILVRGTFAAQMGGGGMIAAAHHSMIASNKEEEMYKEMYLAMTARSQTATSEIVDEINTDLRNYALYQYNGNVSRFEFRRIEFLSANTLRGIIKSGLELSLPNCTRCGSYSFYGNSGMTTLRVPKCEQLGTSSLTSCSALNDVFINEVAYSTAQGFPWGCTNANTVFHFKDGDYDYQGNVVNT